MLHGFGRVPHKVLVDAAKMCGGVAALMLVAIFISGDGFKNFPLSAAPAAPTLSISASPTSVTSGSSATITWSTTNITASVQPSYCFGDGATCSSPVDNATELEGDESIATTTNGTSLFLTTGNKIASIGGWGLIGGPRYAGLNLFDWLPDQKCWGNATSSTCGTPPRQSIAVSAAMVVPFTIGSTQYIAGTGSAFDSRTYVFKWMTTGATGSACASGGGWGDGTTCGATSTNMMLNSDWAEYEKGFFTVGANYYLMIGGTLYKWTTGSSCPSGGMWGNGTTCTPYNPTSVVKTPAVQTLSALDDGSTSASIVLTNIGGTEYLTAFKDTSPTGVVYKWTASGTGCPTGGGWGNGTKCPTAFQSFKAAVTPNGYAEGLDVHTYGGATYVVAGRNVYIWTTTGTGCPAGGSWGNGTSTCSTTTVVAPASTLLDSGKNDSGIFVEGGSNLFIVAGGKVYKLLSTLGCFGDDTLGCGRALQDLTPIIARDDDEDEGGPSVGVTSFTYNGDSYVVAPNGSAQVQTYKGFFPSSVMPLCLGDGATCGSAINQPAIKSDGSGSTFTAGGSSYLAVASASSIISVYAWMPPPANGGSGCFGDGSTCKTALYNLNVAPGFSSFFKATTIATATFLQTLQPDLANPFNPSYVTYKWMPSPANSGLGCFGDGTTCGTSLTGGVLSGSKIITDSFTVAGVSYALVSDSASQSSIYQWMPASSCLGNGATCGTSLQSIAAPGSGNYNLAQTFQYGSAVYMAYFNPTAGSIAFYKWMPPPANTGKGCFGNGFACSTTFSAQNGLVSVANVSPFNQFSPALVNLFSTTSASFLTISSGSFGPSVTKTYQWIPASNCFGDGITCGNTADSRTTSQFYGASVLSNSTDNYYVGVSSSGNVSMYRLWNYQPAAAGCHVESPLGTTLWNGTSGSESTGPLTEDTTYTLVCQTSLGQMTQSVTITVTPPPEISVSAPAPTAAEGASPTSGTFRITRSTASSADLTINFSMGGTALRGTDYSFTGSGAPGSGVTTVTIPASSGSATVNLTVTPIDDSATEGNETAILTVLPGSGYAVASSPDDSATVTITDDELASSLPTLNAGSLTVSPSRVRKGGETAVSWNVTGLAPTNTCQLTTAPSVGGFPQSWNKVGTSWVNGVNVAIQQQTIFTLRCTAPDGSQTATAKTVTILPVFQEI